MVRTKSISQWLTLAGALYCFAGSLSAQQKSTLPSSTPIARAALTISHIDRAPTIEDFADIDAKSPMALTMTHVNGFFQRIPDDHAPVSQKTDAYLGYDQANLYVVFVCHDDHPQLIRSQLTKRENANDDDQVQIVLDTYKDQRRGYIFAANPIGIQAEGLYSEDNGTDYSWDTVWNTSGRRLEHGYVVVMSIPFRSLRFSHEDMQQWGFLLERKIPRNNEVAYWPYVTDKINGRLNQEARLDGLEHISPGRNIELNPYGIWRASRSLNNLDTPPRFEGEALGGRAGGDGKLVIKDSLVLDVTVKPDFSQIESDEPQVTVNQRFPVYFPEKRPFFLENSNYFNTNYQLLYTRNIVDPEYGARLTGKIGKFSLGFIYANDRSPGQAVASTDPEFGKKAQFAIGRVNYDLFGRSTIGVMYTDREFDGSFNRIGGVDGSFKLKKNYFANFQALESSTKDLQGNYFAGPAVDGGGGFSGKHLNANTYFESNAAGYQTLVGFYARPDYTRFSNFVSYRWWPENSFIVNHGPQFVEGTDWDHTGLRLDTQVHVAYHVEFKGNTYLNLDFHADRSRLRPQDYGTLVTPQDYANGGRHLNFVTNHFKKVSFGVSASLGDTPNVIPVSGPPRPAFEQYLNAYLTLKLFKPLQVTTSYLGDYWQDAIVRNQSLYDLHVIRTKWNYQLNKEMSVRFIGQYNTDLSHPALVALDTTKQFNYDLLFTYLLHPGTAVYVGYNTDLSTLDPALVSGPNGFAQRPNLYINDGRQVFVKLSYLFRF